MNNFFENEIKQNVFFVDCFNTVIHRKIKTNQIFKNWADELSAKYNFSGKLIYKTYKKVNFKLCFKKIFAGFILQEQFTEVLKQMFFKLFHHGSKVELKIFIETALSIYETEESKVHYVNPKFIDFLKRAKENGKKIYIVSDFYCPSKSIHHWLDQLNIDEIFDDVFSSCDYKKEKSTKGLYKLLIKKLSLNKKDIIMFGDNSWSDVFMAKACGLAAKKITKKDWR